MTHTGLGWQEGQETKTQFWFCVNYPIHFWCTQPHHQIMFFHAIIIVIIFAFALAWRVQVKCRNGHVVSMMLNESHKVSCTQNNSPFGENVHCYMHDLLTRLSFNSCQSWLSLCISPHTQTDFLCDAQTRLMKGSLLITCVNWQYSSSFLHQSSRLHLNHFQVSHLWLENNTHL